MNQNINQIVSGFLVTAYLVAGLFFTKFWRASHDRLFLIFACAFGLLGLQRLAFALSTAPDENLTYLYVARLVAFVLIIVAIIDKNRVAKGQ